MSGKHGDNHGRPSQVGNVRVQAVPASKTAREVVEGLPGLGFKKGVM